MKIEVKGVRVEGKKKQVDEKKRVCPYFPLDLYRKLNRIARACNRSDAEILLAMAENWLNQPQLIVWIQDRFGVSKDDPFRITPIIENGKVNY